MPSGSEAQAPVHPRGPHLVHAGSSSYGLSSPYIRLPLPAVSALWIANSGKI